MEEKTIGRSTIFLFVSVNILITVGVVFVLLFIVIPKVSAATGCFPDTNGHWAEEFICWMSDSGLTGGYPDGTYKPENNVTRAEMAVFMKNSYDLEASEDDDTLGSLSCSTDQIAKWNGSAWECQADLSGSGSDTLGSLSCTTDQIAKWNGSAWVCAEDVDTDTDTDTDSLGSLSCSTDQIAKWNGSAWVCQADLSGSGTDTLGSLSCTTGQIAKWNGSAWVCAEDVDTDTDTLGSLTCPTDRILLWNGGAWVCSVYAYY